MKKILLCSIFLILVSACNNQADTQTSHSICVTLLIDTTDPHLLIPEANTFLTLLAQQGTDKPKLFRLTGISNKVFNQTTSLYFPNQTETEKANRNDDALFRERCVAQYYSQVQSEINKVNQAAHQSNSIPTSECFRCIAKELRFIATQEFERKQVYCYSDLADHSNIYNSYTIKEYSEKTIESIVKRYESMHLLPESLSGIEVTFQYIPPDTQSDKRYQVMSEVFRRIIEAHHGKVTFTSNTYEP